MLCLVSIDCYTLDGRRQSGHCWFSMSEYPRSKDSWHLTFHMHVPPFMDLTAKYLAVLAEALAVSERMGLRLTEAKTVLNGRKFKNWEPSGN